MAWTKATKGRSWRLWKISRAYCRLWIRCEAWLTSRIYYMNSRKCDFPFPLSVWGDSSKSVTCMAHHALGPNQNQTFHLGLSLRCLGNNLTIFHSRKLVFILPRARSSRLSHMLQRNILYPTQAPQITNIGGNVNHDSLSLISKIQATNLSRAKSLWVSLYIISECCTGCLVGTLPVKVLHTNWTLIACTWCEVIKVSEKTQALLKTHTQGFTGTAEANLPKSHTSLPPLNCNLVVLNAPYEVIRSRSLSLLHFLLDAVEIASKFFVFSSPQWHTETKTKAYLHPIRTHPYNARFE